jgi:hypothetical protein
MNLKGLIILIAFNKNNYFSIIYILFTSYIIKIKNYYYNLQ